MFEPGGGVMTQQATVDQPMNPLPGMSTGVPEAVRKAFEIVVAPRSRTCAGRFGQRFSGTDEWTTTSRRRGPRRSCRSSRRWRR